MRSSPRPGLHELFVRGPTRVPWLLPSASRARRVESASDVRRIEVRCSFTERVARTIEAGVRHGVSTGRPSPAMRSSETRPVRAVRASTSRKLHRSHNPRHGCGGSIGHPMCAESKCDARFQSGVAQRVATDVRPRGSAGTRSPTMRSPTMRSRARPGLCELFVRAPTGSSIALAIRVTDAVGRVALRCAPNHNPMLDSSAGSRARSRRAYVTV